MAVPPYAHAQAAIASAREARGRGAGAADPAGHPRRRGLVAARAADDRAPPRGEPGCKRAPRRPGRRRHGRTGRPAAGDPGNGRRSGRRRTVACPRPRGLGRQTDAEVGGGTPLGRRAAPDHSRHADRPGRDRTSPEGRSGGDRAPPADPPPSYCQRRSTRGHASRRRARSDAQRTLPGHAPGGSTLPRRPPDPSDAAPARSPARTRRRTADRSCLERSCSAAPRACETVGDRTARPPSSACITSGSVGPAAGEADEKRDRAMDGRRAPGRRKD